MSVNPFAADSTIRLRCEEMYARNGAAIFEKASKLSGDTGILKHDDAGAMIAEFGFGDVEELMRVLQPYARRYARPVVSGFEVGAVGLEAETGNLIFGGNIEFAGTHFGTTIHGETALAARSFMRGTTLRRIALSEAHPCGHCRQFLSEFASAPALRLIDPLGHSLALAELLPWPFDPAYLGETGAMPDQIASPDLSLTENADWAGCLIEAGRRAHAPYSHNPAAVALRLSDGSVIAGASIESVAYNPSMGPFEVAFAELAGRGRDAGEILEIHLAERPGRPVNHAHRAGELAAAVAPKARFYSHAWKE